MGVRAPPSHPIKEKNMDKKRQENFKAMREDIDKALAEVAKKYNLDSLKAGVVTANQGGSFVFKLEGVEKGGRSIAEILYDDARTMMPNWPDRRIKIRTKFDLMIITGANSTGSRIFATGENTGGEYELPIKTLEDKTRWVYPADWKE